MVYNIGSAETHANIDVVKIILRELKCSEGLISFVEDRKGHDLAYAVDSSRALADLGWRPTVSFAVGLKATVSWYNANREWLQGKL